MNVEEVSSSTPTATSTNIFAAPGVTTDPSGCAQSQSPSDNDAAQQDDEECSMRAVRSAFLRYGVPVPPVELYCPRVVSSLLYPSFNMRAIRQTGSRTNAVNRSGPKYFHNRTQYFRRGEKNFVTSKEIQPSATKCYARASRSGRKLITKKINASTVPHNVYAAYKQVVASFTKVLLEPGLHGTGIFAGEDIEEERFVMEYTGNRINRKKSLLMHRSLDRLDLSPDVLVYVQISAETVDHRGSGNAAMCINHSCDPNAELYGVHLELKTIVIIRALKPITAGDEITCDYVYNSLLANVVLICE